MVGSIFFFAFKFTFGKHNAQQTTKTNMANMQSFRTMLNPPNAGPPLAAPVVPTHKLATTPSHVVVEPAPRSRTTMLVVIGGLLLVVYVYYKYYKTPGSLYSNGNANKHMSEADLSERDKAELRKFETTKKPPVARSNRPSFADPVPEYEEPNPRVEEIVEEIPAPLATKPQKKPAAAGAQAKPAKPTTRLASAKEQAEQDPNFRKIEQDADDPDL